MEMKTEAKTIKLVVKTKKIIAIARGLNDDKFEDGFFNAVRENSIEKLANIIMILAETDDNTNPFETLDKVCDFLDEYMEATNKTYADIYMDIAKEINDKGFFSIKMKERELKNKVNDPLSSLNYEDVMKNAVEKMATQVIEDEFKGYKG